jgi:2'-hydroxyisoflavone reductase
MNILVFGGTQFLGRHFVELALQKGHTLTLVQRGQTGADLFPSVPRILLNRRESLDSIPTEGWDAVVDFSAYLVKDVTKVIERLPDIPHYVLISTISVYDLDQIHERPSEGSAVIQLADESVEEINAETYGGLKAAIERIARDHYGDRLMVIRPGIVIGPYDHTNRFHQWIKACAEEEELAGPPRLDQPFQGIDGRDLGAFCLSQVEQGTSGTANVVGDLTTLGEILREARRQARRSESITEGPSERPMLLPADGSRDLIFQCSDAEALKRGLRRRPYAETIADVRTELGV